MRVALSLVSFAVAALLPQAALAQQSQVPLQFQTTPQFRPSVASKGTHVVKVPKIQTATLASIRAASQNFLENDEDGFSSFTHPSFPAHGLRIKSVSDWCDTTVDVYAGWLDFASAGSKHLFFWFFESRDKPSEDPVLMWINGGPGSSSAVGAFMELGPCSIDLKADKSSDNRTVWNPYGWNAHANIFFLEQPVGVGYSYADDGSRVRTTPEAAPDVAAFISMFFGVFDEFKGRAFHMTGESYGGRYLPLFASAVLDANERAREEGREPVNLQSVMIGNGLTEPVTTFLSTYDMLCTPSSGYEAPLPIARCVELKNTVNNCYRMTQAACLDTMDVIACSAALSSCTEALHGDVWVESGRNPYDLNQRCKDTWNCFKEEPAITEWLNLNTTRKKLGVPLSVPPYEISSNLVGNEFNRMGDVMTRSDYWVAALLERGVKVLAYEGMSDSVCPWTGNKRVFERLDWSGHDGFAAAPTFDWSSSSSPESIKILNSTWSFTHSMKKEEVGGMIKSFGGLTFFTLKDAGHMVPYNQPERSLAMLTSWLRGDLS